MAARKSQDAWEGSPGSSSETDAVGGVLGDLPCPALGVLARRECAQVWPPHDCKLLILPVELFPDHTLPAGSAPLLSGSTSSA